MSNQSIDIDKMFEVGIELAEHTVSSIKTLEGTIEESTYKYAVFFFFCKAYKAYQSIRLLCRKGFWEDAQILCRTIFELCLQSRYLMKNPIKHGELWYNYDMIRRYKYYKKISEIDPDLKNIDEPQKQASIVELKQHYEQHKTEYPRDDNWYGKSIRKLAQEIDENHPDKPYEWWYIKVYAIESGYVHSGSGTIKDYFEDRPDHLFVNCYPTDNVNPRIVVSATLYLLQIIGSLYQAFDLREDEFEIYMNKFTCLRDKLFDASSSE
jgi:hypothetical protein